MLDSSMDCYTVVDSCTPKQSMLLSQHQSNHMLAEDGEHCLKYKAGSIPVNEQGSSNVVMMSEDETVDFRV